MPVPSDLQEFENAVLVMFNLPAQQSSQTTSPQVIHEAQIFLSRVRGGAGQPCHWRYCAEAFTTSGILEVKFWCLQTIINVRNTVF